MFKYDYPTSDFERDSKASALIERIPNTAKTIRNDVPIVDSKYLTNKDMDK